MSWQPLEDGTRDFIEPEPVYESRVVCADGNWKPRMVSSADEARMLVEEWGDRYHAHTIQRRLVGPWEAT